MGQFFRLRPTPELNRIIGYLLGRYLDRYGLTLHAAVFMGNHYHLLVSGDDADITAFARDLNSQLARYLNAREQLSDVKLWSARPPAEIECLDPESAWDDVIYIALNPVAAHIVPSPEKHPGLTILPCHWGEELVFEPPKTFFKFGERGEGPVTIRPTPPPGFDDGDLEKIKSKAMHEIEMRARRIRRNGTKFWGYDDVGLWDCPASLRARRYGGNVATHFPSARFESNDEIFDSCPHYQANNPDLISRAIRWRDEFLDDYTACRGAEKSGEMNVLYPEGTTAYRWRKRARVAPAIDRGWYPLLNYG